MRYTKSGNAANVPKSTGFINFSKEKRDFHFFLFFLEFSKAGVSVILIGYRNLLPITNSIKGILQP
jgi:hypothetical protein